jgi:hypothetical protein
MNCLEAAMQIVKVSPCEVRDSGKVRIGNVSPALPATKPSKAATADNGKVRLGNVSPALPR